ncbi:MAG TPA: VOC family protein [Thermoanaerobaculia bacterium]|nr:VOC family protein [Thermoanaerobaculia bacterium]
MIAMRKITPNLWFDRQAEEAARFYVSIFPNSKITNLTRFPPEVAKAAQMPEATVMTVSFELDGNAFLGLNGGPIFKFSEAVSFIVDCKDQEEVDYFWDRLTAGGGEPGQCGWLKDRFGLSWQIVPSVLPKLMTQSDPEKQRKVGAAMMKMKKIDIAALEQAAEG